MDETLSLPSNDFVDQARPSDNVKFAGSPLGICMSKACSSLSVGECKLCECARARRNCVMLDFVDQDVLEYVCLDRRDVC
jgi:hypothetical protein